MKNNNLPPIQGSEMPPMQSAPEVSIEDQIAEKDLLIEEKDEALAKANAEIEKLKQSVSKVEVVIGKYSIEVVKAFEAGKPVQVQALSKGIYPNCTRRAKGDIFKVVKIEDFSSMWMSIVK